MSGKKRKCIFVIGMHRSGTSAMAGALHQLGIPIGKDIMAPNQYNEKGYFENNRVYVLNEQFLQLLGVNWSTTYMIEKNWWKNDQLLSSLKKKLSDYIDSEFAKESVFLIKDPRISVLLPIWIELMSGKGIESKFIILLRDPHSVSMSLMERDGFTFEKSERLWADYNLKIEYFTRNYDRIFINFEDLIEDPNSILKIVQEFLGMEIEDTKNIVNEFLDPSLCHHRSKDHQSNSRFAKIYDILGKGTDNNSKRQRDWYDEYKSKLQDDVMKLTPGWVEKNEVSITADVRARIRESELLDIKDQIISQHRTENQSLLGEVENLRDQIKSLEDNFGSLSEKVELLAREKEALLKEGLTTNAVVKAQLQVGKRLTEEIELYKNSLRENLNEKKSLELASNRYRDEINELRKIISVTSKKIQNLETEVHEYAHSISWRITLPFRKISSVFVSGRKFSDTDFGLILNLTLLMLRHPLKVLRKINLQVFGTLANAWSNEERSLIFSNAERFIIRSGEGSIVNGSSTFQRTDDLGNGKTDAGFEKIVGFRSKKHWNKSILLVSHASGSNMYGGERSFMDILEALSQNNQNVIVCIPYRNQSFINRVRAFVDSLYFFKYGWWEYGKDLDFEVIRLFEEIIISENIDIIYVNTIMLQEPLIAARNVGKPSVVHARELISKDKALAERMSGNPDEIIGQVVRNSDFLIANSQATREEYDIHSNKYLLYNRIDSSLFSLPLPSGEGTLKVGLISSNLPKKGIYDFYQLALISSELGLDIKYILIGEKNEYIHNILENINDLGKEIKLECAGYYSSTAEAMKLVDVVVNFSHFAESFGRTIAEGMAAGRPVIGYRWGALEELIVHEETGWLIEYLNFHEAIPILEKLSIEKRLLCEVGEKGRVRARKLFSVEVFQSQLSQIVNGISDNWIDEVKDANAISSKSSVEIRIAYFLWHFPVPSETFVLSEIKHLIENTSARVFVFCRQSPYPDFNIGFDLEWRRVQSVKEFSSILVDLQIDIAHSIFVYPTVTDFLYPACKIANIPFTFSAHAAGIFRHANDDKNKIAEITNHPLCQKVFVPGKFHLKYLLDKGVDNRKIRIAPQCIELSSYNFYDSKRKNLEGGLELFAIGRFVEKKGFQNLIMSANALNNHGVSIHIYGYGPLEDMYNEIIDEHQISNVVLHGKLAGASEISKVFKKHDILIQPSIRAGDGDMDGVPTILIEAMSAGVPVISSNLSSIPELVIDGFSGFLLESADPDSIVARCLEVMEMPDNQVDAILSNAKAHVENNYDISSITRHHLREWQGDVLNVVIVTYNNLPEFKEVFRRLMFFTTTPFRVTVVDNGSDQTFREYLMEIQSQYEIVSVLFQDKNLFVGPATNIGVVAVDSTYAVYLCGKEGWILDYGWEVAMIDYMESNKDVGIAGTLGYSPTYLFGSDFKTGVRLFNDFRNQSFAGANPAKEFRHVQGGLFILRRKMFDQIGGFSKKVPHEYTDVEYSYYVESCGWKLGEIRRILSLYNKTRPTFRSRLHRGILAMHPGSIRENELIDSISDGSVLVCNLCVWTGTAFVRNSKGGMICPGCRSSGLDRLIFHYLTTSSLLYRRLPVLVFDLSESLQVAFERSFQIKKWDLHRSNDSKLPFSNNSIKMIYCPSSRLLELSSDELTEIRRVLSAGATVLIGIDDFGVPKELLREVAEKCNLDFECRYQESNYTNGLLGNLVMVYKAMG